MSSSLVRALRNIWRIGPREYIRQMNGIGDSKFGTLVGTDVFGNKYFENSKEDEIYGRTRWIEYPTRLYEVSTISPGWHAWLTQRTDTPPNALSESQKAIQAVPAPTAGTIQTYTGTTQAYVPYSTVKPKVQKWTWSPKVAERV